MALIDEVKRRHGENFLRQLTNEDAAATTINDTILQAACDDAVAEFQRVARQTFDVGLSHHVSLGVKGAMYHLFYYKGHDDRQRDKYERDFYGGLGNLSNIAYTLAETTSTLDVKQDQVGANSDMSNRNRIFGRRRVQGLNEINEG